jgi:hypothetical protein
MDANLEGIPPVKKFRPGQFDRDPLYGVRDVTQYADRKQ